MKFLRLADLDLQGKRVFIRADLNVPQDDSGAITDDTRIRASVPGIKLALEKGAAVMVTSHLGRPTEGALSDKDSLADRRAPVRAPGPEGQPDQGLGRRRLLGRTRAGGAAGELPRQQGREEE